MKTKLLFVLAMILFMANAAFAESPFTKGAAVTKDRYPDASSVIIEDITEVNLERNGDYSEYSYNLIKPMTESAVKAYGTMDFSYNSRYQEISDITIKIYLPDGTVREVPKSAYTDGTHPAFQAMNIFEGSFRMKSAAIGSFPLGSLIEISKTSKTKRLIKDNFCGTYYLQSTEPLLKSSVKISAPTDMPLKYSVRNGKASFSEKTENGKRILIWETENNPQIISEPCMPSAGDIACSLSISSFKTWKEASAFLYSLNKDKYKAGAEIKKKTAELTAGLTSEEDKILAIHRFVSQKIRYMGSSMDVGAFVESHEAEYTLEKGYGVCRDKAVLMTSMLHEAGVERHDCLINPSSETEENVPTIFFQHLVCLVKTKDGKNAIMDPTAEFSAGIGSGYAGERYVLPITEEGSDIILMPTSPTKDNAGIISSKCILNNDMSLSYDAELKSCGEYETSLRQAKNAYKAEEFELLFNQIASMISPGTKITELKYGNPSDLACPFVINMKASAENYAIKAGRYIILPLPSRRLPLDLLASAQIRKWGSTRTRNYDISLQSPIECSFIETVKIPAGYKAVSLPPAEKISGDAEINLSVKEKDGVIIFEGKASVKTRTISKSHYEEIKKAAAALKNFEKRMIILEKVR
ncbi:MAG: DUF3857 domain-containing protein [bacterium]|nr:DUF3857 domain-containing protein [bacterium]